jgi:hypothetical protein
VYPSKVGVKVYDLEHFWSLNAGIWTIQGLV